MRAIERIEAFKDIDISLIGKRWGITFYSNPLEDKELLDHWYKYPDLRFGQLLINDGIIEDNFRIWIDEDMDILLSLDVDLSRILKWGAVLDKEGNPTGKIIYRYIADMDTDHIIAVLKFIADAGRTLPDKYAITFKKELLKRKQLND